MHDYPSHALAVIGMACQVPGASSARAFWNNVLQGKVSIRHFSIDELIEAGIERDLLTRENYVKACGYLDDADRFDAAFFKMRDIEAAMTDPQHRLLLQCAWHAFESAGTDPMAASRRIGCFVGTGMSLFAGRAYDCYLTRNLLAQPELVDEWAAPQITVANRNDYAATKLAYAFDLKGPAVNVQTACSTGLSTVHMAISSLLLGECDTALAGAASVHVPLKRGYLFEGGLLSPDGSCRPFAHSACGTVGGSGVGVVVLRRLEDALADGDPIRAIVRGSAMNNDGKHRVSFLAPSVDGQVEVIGEAMDKARVRADTIGFIETHGTGTPLGDSIEINGLTTAYRRHTSTVGFCALGATKANIGHLDTTAGIASFIKAVAVLEHGVVPPLASFDEPNPALSLDSSPFWIPTSATQWRGDVRTPRRAGVSCFGAGGTNVHIVLEAPPAPSFVADGSRHRGKRVLPLSAKTPRSLAKLCESHRAQLADNMALSFSDLAVAVAVGRHHHLGCRAAIVASDCEEALDALLVVEAKANRAADKPAKPRKPKLAMLFPGQGFFDTEVARAAYQALPTFRQHFDRCSRVYESLACRSLSEAVLDSDGAWLHDPAIFQCMAFATSAALLHVWKTLGVEPSLVIGHSLGEYAAAYTAGVVDLDGAMQLVEARGRLIGQYAHAGGMLIVGADVAATADLIEAAGLRADACISGYDAPRATAVSGTHEACVALRERALSRGWLAVPLAVSHPFHSHLIEPAIEPFRNVLARVPLRRPVVDMVRTSHSTDLPVDDHRYWLAQLRQPVSFAKGVLELRERDAHCLLEVGTGRSLLNLAKATLGDDVVAVPSLAGGSPESVQTGALAMLYEAGIDVDWQAVHVGATRKQAPSLPLYPFEIRRHWLERTCSSSDAPRPVRDSADVVEWCLSWKPAQMIETAWSVEACLVIGDIGATVHLAECLRSHGIRMLRAEIDADLAQWFDATQQHTRRAVVYAPVSSPGPEGDEAPLAAMLKALTDLVRIVRSMLNQGAADCYLVIVTQEAQHASAWSKASAALDPGHAALWGFARAIRREVPDLPVHLVDVPAISGNDAEEIVAELSQGLQDEEVSWRDGRRYRPHLHVRESPVQALTVRGDGVYLISGGWGGLGLAISTHLVASGARHLILIGRSTPGQDAARTLATLSASGARVDLVSADVGRAEGVESIAAAVRDADCPLRGIVHAAGTVHDATLANMTDEAIFRVFAPKLVGALNLDAFACGDELDFFVAFSSAAALLGAPGQANYCAANASMDAVMMQRMREGRPAAIIHWGPWKEVGMAARNQDKAQPFGLDGLDIAAALACFERTCGMSGEVFVAGVKPHALPVVEGRDVGPLTAVARRIWDDQSAVSDAAAHVDGQFVELSRVLDDVIPLVARLAEVDEKDVAPCSGLVDLGIDSMRAMQLRAQLNRRFSVQLPPMAMFTDGTPEKIAEQIRRLMERDLFSKSFER